MNYCVDLIGTYNDENCWLTVTDSLTLVPSPVPSPVPTTLSPSPYPSPYPSPFPSLLPSVALSPAPTMDAVPIDGTDFFTYDQDSLANVVSEAVFSETHNSTKFAVVEKDQYAINHDTTGLNSDIDKCLIDENGFWYCGIKSSGELFDFNNTRILPNITYNNSSSQFFVGGNQLADVFVYLNDATGELLTFDPTTLPTSFPTGLPTVNSTLGSTEGVTNSSAPDVSQCSESVDRVDTVAAEVAILGSNYTVSTGQVDVSNSYLQKDGKTYYKISGDSVYFWNNGWKASNYLKSNGTDIVATQVTCSSGLTTPSLEGEGVPNSLVAKRDYEKCGVVSATMTSPTTCHVTTENDGNLVLNIDHNVAQVNVTNEGVLRFLFNDLKNSSITTSTSDYALDFDKSPLETVQTATYFGEPVIGDQQVVDVMVSSVARRNEINDVYGLSLRQDDAAFAEVHRRLDAKEFFEEDVLEFLTKSVPKLITDANNWFEAIGWEPVAGGESSNVIKDKTLVNMLLMFAGLSMITYLIDSSLSNRNYGIKKHISKASTFLKLAAVFNGVAIAGLIAMDTEKGKTHNLFDLSTHAIPMGLDLVLFLCALTTKQTNTELDYVSDYLKDLNDEGRHKKGSEVNVCTSKKEAIRRINDLIRKVDSHLRPGALLNTAQLGDVVDKAKTLNVIALRSNLTTGVNPIIPDEFLTNFRNYFEQDQAGLFNQVDGLAQINGDDHPLKTFYNELATNDDERFEKFNEAIKKGNKTLFNILNGPNDVSNEIMSHVKCVLYNSFWSAASVAEVKYIANFFLPEANRLDFEHVNTARWSRLGYKDHMTQELKQLVTRTAIIDRFEKYRQEQRQTFEDNVFGVIAADEDRVAIPEIDLSIDAVVDLQLRADGGNHSWRTYIDASNNDAEYRARVVDALNSEPNINIPAELPDNLDGMTDMLINARIAAIPVPVVNPPNTPFVVDQVNPDVDLEAAVGRDVVPQPNPNGEVVDLNDVVIDDN